MNPTLQYPIQKGVELMSGSMMKYDPLVIVTLLFLGILSLVCWTIIGAKICQIWKMRRGHREIISSLSPMTPSLLKRMQAVAHQYPDTPMSKLIAALSSASRQIESLSSVSVDIWHQNLLNVSRSAIQLEMQSLERGVPLLATTASAAPFIGLFGTVWGVIDSFRNMGVMTGFASFHTVAPGMASALVATAAGLAVAIPALIAYNLLINHFHSLEQNLERCCNQLMMGFYNRLNHEDEDRDPHTRP